MKNFVKQCGCEIFVKFVKCLKLFSTNQRKRKVTSHQKAAEGTVESNAQIEMRMGLSCTTFQNTHCTNRMLKMEPLC